MIGTLWPIHFDNLDMELDVLETDILRVIAQSDDSQLQDKLKENIELVKNVQNNVEHTFKEEPSSPLVDKSFSNSEATPTTMSDNTFSSTMVNATEVSSSSSSITSNDNVSTTSPAPPVVSISNLETPPNSTIPPPPPPLSSSSSTPMTSPNAKTPTPTIPTAMPATHSVVSTPPAYRQQTGLLGVLPSGAAARGMPGAVYATTSGLANSLTGQIIYGGKRKQMSI